VVRSKPIYAHADCLAWCPDLYQSEDLQWQNVAKALNRCHRLKCAVCGEGDAPLGCKRVACKKNWHYPCAMEPGDGRAAGAPERSTASAAESAAAIDATASKPCIARVKFTHCIAPHATPLSSASPSVDRLARTAAAEHSSRVSSSQSRGWRGASRGWRGASFEARCAGGRGSAHQAGCGNVVGRSGAESYQPAVTATASSADCRSQGHSVWPARDLVGPLPASTSLVPISGFTSNGHGPTSGRKGRGRRQC